jgi:hypothetical protein
VTRRELQLGSDGAKRRTFGGCYLVEWIIIIMERCGPVISLLSLSLGISRQFERYRCHVTPTNESLMVEQTAIFA